MHDNKIKTLLFIFFILTLTGCNGFFEKDNTPPFSPLTEIKSEIKPKLLWREKAANNIGTDYLKNRLNTDHNLLFVTSKKGLITALNLCSGKIIWQVSLDQIITSGPGVGDNIVVVGTNKGKVIALRQNNGCILWQNQVEGEIIATPTISNHKIIVKTTNGNVYALTLQDGNQLWSYQQNEPSLILRGASTPMIADYRVIAGFANGKLIKLNLANGLPIWEQTIAVPEGAFAIQRMVDIDADPLLFNQEIYAATYQGKIAALNWSRGTIKWSRDISTYTGMTIDYQTLFISDAKSHLWAFEKNSGSTQWTQSLLQYRGITAPVMMNSYLVVGDKEGYLHWLNKTDGHLVGRISDGRGAIYATPLVENNTLYVLSSRGYISAYTINR